MGKPLHYPQKINKKFFKKSSAQPDKNFKLLPLVSYIWQALPAHGVCLKTQIHFYAEPDIFVGWKKKKDF